MKGIYPVSAGIGIPGLLSAQQIDPVPGVSGTHCLAYGFFC